MRAFLPDACKASGCGEGAVGGAFCAPVGGVVGGLGAGVPLARAWALVSLAGAVFLVLDGAFFEGEANGVNAIAKIRRGIEAFAGKHVA